MWNWMQRRAARAALSANKVWKKRDRRWRIIYLKQYVKNNETDIRGYMRQDVTRRDDVEGAGSAKQIVAWILRHVGCTLEERGGERERENMHMYMCANTAWRTNFRGIGCWEVENANTASIWEWNKMKYKRKLYWSKNASEKKRKRKRSRALY